MRFIRGIFLLPILSGVFFTPQATAENYWGIGLGNSAYSLKPLYGSYSLQDSLAIRGLYGMRNKNMGFEVELSYADYAWQNATANSHTNLNMVVAGVTYLPVAHHSSLFASVGANFWSTDVNYSGQFYEGDSGIGFALSAGLDVKLSERLHLSGEFQYLPGLSDGVDKGDISQFFINALFYY